MRTFWRRKLAGNKTRDRVVNRALRRAGWRVLRIWEHELTRKNEARLVKRLKSFLKKQRTTLTRMTPISAN
jgi:DNA mismatch endonuclease (patch repair protein)